MKMHKRNGFTLTELLVVIVAMGVLLAISTVGYTAIKRDSRDSARSSQTTIIVEALEKYYEKNGEYPSVPSIAGQSINTVKQKLAITDIAVLTFPLAADGTNSVVSSGPSDTRLVYEGSGATPAETTQCRTSSTSYCDAFRLRYVTESDEQTVTITSRRGTFTP